MQLAFNNVRQWGEKYDFSILQFMPFSFVYILQAIDLQKRFHFVLVCSSISYTYLELFQTSYLEDENVLISVLV